MFHAHVIRTRRGGGGQHALAKLFPSAAHARHFIVTRLLLLPLNSEMEGQKMSILRMSVL